MKTITKLIAGVIAIATFAGTAQAQNVNHRQYNQDHRIEQGVRNGRLTPAEARNVSHQQHSIARQENRMRYRNGGHLTRRDRARLQHRQDRASRHIYRAKHNHRHY